MYRKIINVIKAQPRWRLIVAGLALAGAVVFLSRGSKATADMATFEARRGALQISVLEGGTLQALSSQELKCEVRVGYQGTKILKIVDEGYMVTEEDVKNGKVLVELDSSELQKQLVQQEILYQSSSAALADATQGYEIQEIQNLSDILAAEQKARFARMDFEKFLGNRVAQDIIKEIGVETRSAFTSTNIAPRRNLELPPEITTTNRAPFLRSSIEHGRTNKPVLLASLEIPPSLLASTNGSAAAQPSEPVLEMRKPSSINFAVYADVEKLGDGEAKQKLRKFQDDLQVARKEEEQSRATHDGTKRLYDKGFVTRTDLQRDTIAYQNMQLKVRTAETASDLFLKYEFLKTAEETLSKYCEAVRDMERVGKSAIAKLAQADAKLKSATVQYNVQLRQRRDLEQQIEKCSIRSEKPGLVIYGRAGDEGVYFGGEERVREGAPVRERQTILTIPDLTTMGVRVKIHETYIKKVRVGQKARITVDAFPDKQLEGEVTKVGVLPDSQNRWMNPDMKVYLTTIEIHGTHDWLKPGMSTKAEVMIDRLEDVVYVPIQSVVPERGEYASYVPNAGKAERRKVEVGQFNDEFIEVKSGLTEGESVLLNPPRLIANVSDGYEDHEPGATSAPPARATTAMPAPDHAPSQGPAPSQQPERERGSARRRGSAEEGR
jgi:HlyD family secretion protein